MSSVNTAAVIGKHVATAIDRHRDTAGFVRLVAAELPSSERPPWVRMADALDRGDASACTAAATRSIGCWIPLFASQARDPRLAVRLLQTAARPAAGDTGPWPLPWYLTAVTVLAFGLLFFLSISVIPMMRDLHEGSDVPTMTKMVFTLPAFFASIWQPLLAVVGVIAVPFSFWLATRWSARGAATATAFTRTLARLVAADVPAEDALALASHSVDVRPVDPAVPRLPLGYAAAAATEFAPRPAAVLLDAIADCHDDQSRGRLTLAQWLIGPVLIAVVGLIVGLVTVALFMPLVRLVSYLS